MRIPDETQQFEIGDSVMITDSTIDAGSSSVGTVISIYSSSVYYEARPIASFTEYTYVIRVAEQRHYLKARQISSITEN